ncbi:carbohydrate sulfotransferase 5-like isoform X1 [Neodiprion pinetum]|uniref:carbohydrate sulfotransferase 5-like isoform X1 n=1 Tax=Neodiprion pinetum TaxID=441929 RepID=UPI001EDD208F|nr:carbohydrate sulfotransferase 5-like isoform X1 [Neodiprion pinetum]XP_046471358.1 carbohydrate sulfotransferase 5-like isoform X1 [Neodiprion pinetum]XP_046471359.1 carbohydrate sulfotransferase 5-like isoform X1 [Neodiprion pinetum]XP_046471361.1 carbohydrate sulfotransferase 5-like isoform X1 [Neodiprion pinetum]XP_046471362.1 carbohydrate sulfotransferase 5-like isoform X1 [Neodiprion pinetum]
MSKLASFYGLVGLGSLCLVFLFFNQRYGSPMKHRIQPILAVGRSWEDFETTPEPYEFEEPVSNAAVVKEADDSVATLNEIQQVLNLQRRMIRDDMIGYQYPNGRYNKSAKRLEDLVMEKNGKPIRSVIITTWRSGSTFLGDVLTAHPGVFYHYEPLLDFDIVQIRGPPLASQALRNLKALLNCEYEDLDHYIQFGRGHSWLLNHNSPLWKQCQAHRRICYNHRFLSGMCKLFPFQSMKLVRLRLRVAQQLLADEKLAVRLILLVRDPRGTLQSRKHRSFCRESPDCSDPSLLCADMVSDYNAAVELQRKYPSTFRVIRYEDLAVEPYKHVEELFKFYGLDFHPSVKRFLDTHTKNDVGGVSSTYRNSKAAPFHWRADLEFEEVEEIQRNCVVAMKHWGYVHAINASHQREFNPITDYVLRL